MTDRATLLRRYRTRAPRYTSYPTAPAFVPIASGDAARALGAVSGDLSVYVHVPFCTSLCWYCGCNNEIRRRPPADALVDDLLVEWHRAADALGGPGRVRQLHLGGGTPTTLPLAALERLWAGLMARAPAAPGLEAGIELDPRSVDEDYVLGLVAVGFNRFSIGVQDFDPDVMAAVNRVQAPELTERIVGALRRSGDPSISFDLMYGLPLQDEVRFGRTLDRVVALAPGRVALFPYAHLPSLKPAQKLLEAVGLPDADARARLMELAIERLVGAGYVRVGMDHFALPSDPMAEALRSGALHRNFQGYTTCPGLDLIGIGPSAIGCYGGLYAQNHHDRAAWSAALAAGRLPVTRGWWLRDEDRLRARVIADLLCHGETRFGALERARLAASIDRLTPLEVDGIVIVEEDRIQLTPLGQDFARNVVAVFDAWLQPGSDTFSTTS
jgi:oxygen-independent coproporphyrinogen-3 oxidase